MFDFGNANERQRMAIAAAEGPVLITAGPGTGKTYTPPNLDDVLTGTTNLFNVNGLPVEQSTEE